MFSFFPVTIDHLPLLRHWFAQPHVSCWWPTPEKEEDFFAHFLKRIRSSDTHPYIALIDDKPIGYVQMYHIDYNNEKAGKWLPKFPEHTVGIDQLIGEPAYIGKGYGTRMVTDFIRFIKTVDPNITTVIVDPDPENKAAIRCYEKVGFLLVGLCETPYGNAYLMRYDI